jgi:hypothetical protein
MTRNEELRLERLLFIAEEIKKNLNQGLNEIREEYTKKDLSVLCDELYFLIHFSKKEREENETN